MCDGGTAYFDGIDVDQVDTTLTDTGSDVSAGDIFDGTSTTGIDFSNWSNASDYSNEGNNYPNPINTVESNDAEKGYYDDTDARAVNAINTNQNEPKGLWDKTADFVGDKKNNELMKLGVGAAQGLYSGYAANKKDKQAREDKKEQREYDEKLLKLKAELAAGKGGGGGSSALELLAAKDALEQEQNKRYSASITGLKQPGLINKGRKLTYVGGKPVYTDDGKLN